MLGFDADLAPLIDGVNASGRIGLAHVAIEEVDLEVTNTGLLEQTSCLLPRLVDVAAVTREGLELGRSESILVAGPRETTHIFHERNLRHGWRAAPAIDRHGQGLTDPQVVERLPARIDGQ